MSAPPASELRAIGVSWGDPRSARTYSGVPQPLFAELERIGTLVDVADADQTRPSDALHGLVDWRRSVQARRPRRRALWRYLPENIERMSGRFQAVEARLEPHDTVLQFGVAGLPAPDKTLVAHVEIPVAEAMALDVFATSYGFDGIDERTARRAIEGERSFLDRCALVWTNTAWTAQLLTEQGVDDERLRIWPPACGQPDPGPVGHHWDRCGILFVGKDWNRKGGEALLDAFRVVRRARPDATLTIAGCSPPVHEDGVRVLGFLDRDDPRDAAALHEAFVEATIFCMPSRWESTGLVYLEAAMYGLPVVMLCGQGREALFDPKMAVHLPDAEPALLAEALLDLAGAPDRMEAMGAAGRSAVLAKHTLPVVARKVAGWLAEARRGQPAPHC